MKNKALGFGVDFLLKNKSVIGSLKYWSSRVKQRELKVSLGHHLRKLLSVIPFFFALYLFTLSAL